MPKTKKNMSKKIKMEKESKESINKNKVYLNHIQKMKKKYKVT